MGRLTQDLRYAFRLLRNRPSFAIVAVATLALGIGATTAIFTIVNVVILNPFPYKEASRLFFVQTALPKIGVQQQLRASGPEFIDFAQSGIFEDVAAYEGVSRNLTGGEQPERVAAAKVSTEFFSVLGVEPELGRTIDPQEQGPNGKPVLVIGHSLWQRRFGGDRSVLGRKVYLDDEPFIIVGVMPPRFRFGHLDGAEAWFPCAFDFGKAPRGARALAILARLKTGMSEDQTKAQLETLARRQEQIYAAANPEYQGRTFSLESISDFYFGVVRKALFVLLGAVGLVLLIACANIANLLLARSMVRAHEIAIRAAMGANRGRLIRQMLTESVVLALFGGVFGVLLAAWSVRAMVAILPAGTIPIGDQVQIDIRVLLFALGLSVLTAMIFGLWPAFQISRSRVQETLRSGSLRSTPGIAHRRAQNLLVIGEVGLSLVLLVMAGLMIRTFAKLTNIDPGMNTEKIISLRINRSPAKSKDGKEMAPFFNRVIEHVRGVPGVESVAVASHMPFVYTEDWTMTIDSKAIPQEKQTQNVDTRTISPDYFTTLGIPIVAGEPFSNHDGPQSPPVVIINQTMARRFWPGEDAIGKRVKLGEASGTGPWFVVKGVVRDSAQGGLDITISPEIYFSLDQMAGRYRRMNLAVRSSVDPNSLVAAIQKAIHEVDRDQPVYQVQTIKELISDSMGTRRFALIILIVFASLAVVLAATGIYGVISYAVAERTHEMGIRVALGAQTADVLKLVVGQYVRLTLAGVVLGLIAAISLTRMMASLLFGVTATDALTLVCVSVGLIAIALLACYLPARRATKVDPLVALRYE